MGYMGFGMRKEVYTRKAKKAFSKARQVYGRTIGNNKVAGKIKSSKPVSYEKHTYKPFFKTLFYRRAKTTIFIILALMSIWALLLNRPYQNWRKETFENNHLKAYYRNELKEIDDIFLYLSPLQDKIHSIKFTSWNQKYTMEIRNHSIDDNLSDQSLAFYRFEGQRNGRKWNKDSIHSGKLFVTTSDGQTKTYTKNWRYQLKDITITQVPSSVVTYLDMDHAEFSKLMELIKTTQMCFDMDANKSQIRCTYTHPEFGSYTFVYSESPPVDSEVRYKRYTVVSKSQEIGTNVYWIKSWTENN